MKRLLTLTTQRSAAVVCYALKLTLPEMWRFNAYCAQVDVALAAVVDLVIDGVLNGSQSGTFPHAEGLIHFTEAVRGYFREFLVELGCLLVPESKQFFLGGGLSCLVELYPFAGGDAIDDGYGHADELPGWL